MTDHVTLLNEHRDELQARITELENALRRMILYATWPDDEGNDWCRFCDADSKTQHNKPFDRELGMGYAECPVEAARKVLEPTVPPSLPEPGK